MPWLILSASSAPTPLPTDPLPPAARAKVMLIVIVVAVVVLLGLLALTLLSRFWRRSALAPARSPRRARATHSLSPWEQAGRRAAPIDLPPPPAASTGDNPNPPKDSPE